MNSAPTATAVLADDERLMREQLRSRLAQVWPELHIVAEARNGLEAVELVAQHRPQVLFLDIRMPGLTGVDAARQVLQLDLGEDPLPHIVFITAYDQYAVEAFEHGVVDYVLKPAEPERLRLTVQRLQQRLQASAGAPALETPAPQLQQVLHQLSAQLSGRPPQYLKVLQASVGTAVQLIPVDDVLFFISDDKYTRVQTATEEALIRKPIKELVDELDPALFWQIHRSTLVRLSAIQRVSRDHRGRQLVHLHQHPEVLEVSRSHGGLFKGM